MATTNRTNLEIMEFLKKRTSPITLTEIAHKLGKNYQAIKSSIDFLSKMSVVEIITNGHITFILTKKIPVKEVRA